MKDMRRSLRTRAILYTGLGLALVLAIMALQASRMLGSTTQELLAEWRDTVQRNAVRLEDQVEGDQFVIGALADRLAALPGGAGGSSLLWSTLPRLTLFNDGLFWLSPDGQILTEAPGLANSDALLPANLSQALPAADDAHRLSGMLLMRNGHRALVYAASTGGHGTLLAVMDLEARPLDSYLPLPTARGHSAVVDGSGWVLAASQDGLLYTQSEHPDWIARVERQGRPVVEDTGAEGNKESHTMAFAPVGDTGWGLLFGEPTSVALAARLGFIHDALLFGLLADLAVVLYSWWLTGGLTGPLERLAGVTERIAGGDLETPIDVDRQDEIGALARAFETMRQKLRRSRADLNRLVADTRKREEATATLYAVSQEALHPDNAENALQLVAERTRQLLGGTSAAICLADGPTGPLRVAAVTIGPAADAAAVTGPAGGPLEGCTGSETCPLRGEPGSERVWAAINGATPGRLCVLENPDLWDGEEQRLLTGLAGLAALAAARERLQEQSRRLAVYAERERIARDLHDTVSQSLSYLYSQLELLQVLLPGCSTEQLGSELQALSAVASATFDATRDSIYRLRTPATGPDSLPSAIAGCVRDFTARTGIAVDQDTDAAANVNLPAETEAQLVRIVQEALANVAKHAGATRVAVTAAAGQDEMRITVEDNGHGFDPTRPRQGRRSFGLEMMRERAQSVGGLLEIQSSPAKGTRIQLRIATQS